MPHALDVFYCGIATLLNALRTCLPVFLLHAASPPSSPRLACFLYSRVKDPSFQLENVDTHYFRFWAKTCSGGLITHFVQPLHLNKYPRIGGLRPLTMFLLLYAPKKTANKLAAGSLRFWWGLAPGPKQGAPRTRAVRQHCGGVHFMTVYCCNTPKVQIMVKLRV